MPPPKANEDGMFDLRSRNSYHPDPEEQRWLQRPGNDWWQETGYSRIKFHPPPPAEPPLSDETKQKVLSQIKAWKEAQRNKKAQ